MPEPTLLTIIAAIPSVFLGWLAFRQSIKVDRRVQESQASEGLHKLIDQLQEDNGRLASERNALAKELAELKKAAP